VDFSLKVIYPSLEIPHFVRHRGCLPRRGREQQQTPRFGGIRLTQRVLPNRPLRALRGMVATALRGWEERFGARCARIGRPSRPPARLLRAMRLPILAAVRGERQVRGQRDDNRLFRWLGAQAR
jgi:hypothetical protein